MTPPFSSTDWSSIDGGLPGGHDAPRAARRPPAVSSLLLALSLAAAGCAVQEPEPGDHPSEGVVMELIRHAGGVATPVRLDEGCRERLPGLVEELLAGASPVRLLVDEQRIADVRAGGALEVIFDAERRFATLADAPTPAARVLLPLSDPYWVGTAEHPFSVVFLGGEAYGSGPWRNDEGLGTLRAIEACAAAGSEGERTGGA